MAKNINNDEYRILKKLFDFFYNIDYPMMNIELQLSIFS